MTVCSYSTLGQRDLGVAQCGLDHGDARRVAGLALLDGGLGRHVLRLLTLLLALVEEGFILVDECRAVLGVAQLGERDAGQGRGSDDQQTLQRCVHDFLHRSNDRAMARCCPKRAAIWPRRYAPLTERLQRCQLRSASGATKRAISASTYAGCCRCGLCPQPGTSRVSQ